MNSPSKTLAHAKLPAQSQLDLNSTEPKTSTAKVILPNVDIISKRMAPKPSPVFCTYWTFAKKRQDLFLDRIQNVVSFNNDPILSKFRFTNVYRASDRVSQFLIRHVLYDKDWAPVDLLFRTLIFKFFNKISTWNALKESTGEITWANYNFAAYDECLSGMMARGERIYSAAYIMASGKGAYGYIRKHQNHLKIIEGMVNHDNPTRILESKNLSSLFKSLCKNPCIGHFLGYQLAIDLNYGPTFNFSEDEFVEAGPGALDGIAKCFSDLGDLAPADAIKYMADIQEASFERYELDFKYLGGRRLHLIDCQNVFCEISKYARVAHPEILGISDRARIKQNYKRDPHPFERPWYPPSWGINHLLSN